MRLPVHLHGNRILDADNAPVCAVAYGVNAVTNEWEPASPHAKECAEAIVTALNAATIVPVVA